MTRRRLVVAEGDKVLAPDNDGVVREGTVVDVLSVMAFIKFDTGGEAFVFLADRQLQRRET